MIVIEVERADVQERTGTRDNGHQAIQANLSGIPSIAANLLGLAGLGEAMGIIVGAFAFRLTMNTFKRIEFKRS